MTGQERACLTAAGVGTLARSGDAWSDGAHRFPVSMTERLAQRGFLKIRGRARPEITRAGLEALARERGHHVPIAPKAPEVRP